MKRTLAILFIFFFPLSLSAMDQLSEKYLSDYTADNSLNIAKGAASGSSGTFWARYLNDPNNIDFLAGEENEGREKQATQTFQGTQFKLPDYAATVSVVEANDPNNAGMSRMEFTNGLVRTNEGPTTVEVWLGGLANDKNAGKMCDFYSNQIRSHTLPNSTVNISTH